MLAVAYMEYGGPEVLHPMELEEPVAGGGEVVVRVVASTVNPTDIMMRAGQQADLMVHLRPPYVPGVEFAGYVHNIGDSSSALTVGQPVMGIVDARRPGGGAHAQYVSVPAASLVPLAPRVDLDEAATVPMNGLTAKIALEALELPPGSTLILTGGAGAAGGYAIQLAKNAGLTVIADAKDSDVDLLRRLGADEIVPRGDAMDAAVRRLRSNGVDGLIDTALLGNRAGALVRDGGRAISLRRSNPISDPRLSTRWVNVFAQATNTAALVWLGELLRDGILTPRVAVRLPASEAVQAHRLVERGGLRGRIVLKFDDRPTTA
jgi:NADPH2:quinone reductase